MQEEKVAFKKLFSMSKDSSTDLTDLNGDLHRGKLMPIKQLFSVWSSGEGYTKEQCSKQAGKHTLLK